jgi:uncharacterized protein (TIGR02246 family)
MSRFGQSGHDPVGIRAGKMVRVAQFVFIALILWLPAVASAGPVEDANAAVDRWSAAYSSNDPETIAKTYWPDAILLGTVSPVISEGTEAIVAYFTPTKGSGNKNAIDERRTIVVDDSAVVVTGFYTFTRIVDGKPVPGPSRFTMLVTKRGDEWRIAHHHSSPHVLPKN